MELVVVDAQVVGELVHHGDHDFVAQYRHVVAHAAERQPVQRDAIRELETAVVLAFSTRNALVQAEQVFVWMLVVDHHDHVVEELDEAIWQRVERVSHQIFEGVHSDRLHGKSLPDQQSLSCRGWEGLAELE